MFSNRQVWLWLPLLLLILGAWKTTHTVEVRLRAPDGSPVSGVAITLEQAYTGAVIGDCVTDSVGACKWEAARGLYVVKTDYDIDLISAAAMAESGLISLAITVGDEAISYSFVVGSESVYFDRAPEAATPQPYIPTMADLTAHYAIPTPLPGTGPGPGPAESIPPSPVVAATTVSPDAVESANPSLLVQIAVFIGLVVVLGLGALLLVRLVRRAEGGDR